METLYLCLQRILHSTITGLFEPLQSGRLRRRGKGKPDTVSRVKTIQAVLDFSEASQRFRSRAP
ncbi:unnamed protein product [Penicillium camemberti]|uniref:Str. FM013 n=1 Tax=Penicillium camemberti (strain FM 013) TaxID=1429867 RepID=A0A0G4PN33_PENC3|nr:unnamed protein product [Penicillium camemberti]